MEVDFTRLAHASIQQMCPYKPGKPIEELAREQGLTDIIKLGSNENPLGASPKAIAAVKAVIGDIHYYPDPSGYELKKALAEKFNTDTNHITLTNGSDELLRLLVQAYAGPGIDILASQYGFSAYKLLGYGHQANVILVDEKNWQTDLDGFIDQLTDKTRLIFLANPNNPTGTWFNQSALSDFLTKVPNDVLVVLDEAYYEFAIDLPGYPDSLALQKQFPNLVITRTFSKAYGLAGLRLGYSFSHPTVVDILNRIRLPFIVTTAAQVAALAALNDHEHLANTLEANQQGMQQLQAGLESLNLYDIPSVCNFITVDLKQPAQACYQALLKHGIITRTLEPYAMPNHLRISIGSAEQIDKLLTALKRILA